MSEREGFLQRWSRRKREQIEPASAQAAERKAIDPSPATATGAGQPASAASTGIAVDLSKLPPIESITAATDIRPFLAPGVPIELSRAALRRAWAADPAIRDFVGLAENQWDFTAPEGGIPGFGALGNADEVRRMLAEIIRDNVPGHLERSPLPSQEPAAPKSVALAPQIAADTPTEKLEIPEGPNTSAASDAAPQNEQDDTGSLPPRRHGSALPE